MPQVLTIDTGLSNMLKIATVDDSYLLRDFHQESIAPENLQGKIIQEVLRSGLEEFAISSTWFVSADGKQGFIEKEEKKVAYIDLNEIHQRTGTFLQRSAIYNDAEATALALNVYPPKKIIQEGERNKHEADIKTLVYLGTGFQLVRSHYHYDVEQYLPDYGGGLMAAIPISLLDDVVSYDFLNAVVEKAKLSSLNKLRHTHLLSARGLSYIHAVLTAEKKETSSLIEEGTKHQETFVLYSRILGRCLQNFASDDGFLSGVVYWRNLCYCHCSVSGSSSFERIFCSAAPYHQNLLRRDPYNRSRRALCRQSGSGVWIKERY